MYLISFIKRFLDMGLIMTVLGIVFFTWLLFNFDNNLPENYYIPFEKNEYSGVVQGKEVKNNLFQSDEHLINVDSKLYNIPKNIWDELDNGSTIKHLEGFYGINIKEIKY